MGLAVHHPGMQAIEQLSDGAVAVGFNMMRELTDTSPDEVLTCRPTPDDISPYRRFFGVTPRFNAEQHALVFPASLLGCPVRGADPELRRVLEKPSLPIGLWRNQVLSIRSFASCARGSYFPTPHWRTLPRTCRCIPVP